MRTSSTATGVSFLIRMKPNLKAYKEVFAKHPDELESGENGSCTTPASCT